MRKNKIKNNKSRNKKGITLISLVITIIVLLILAGISISMLTGNNGILNRASESKENTRAGTIQERIALAVIENTSIDHLNNGTKKTKVDVIEELKNEGILEENEVILLQTTDTIQIGDKVVDFSPLNAAVLQIGDVVTASGLATFVDDENNDIKWIYFGTDGSGKRLVTTQKSVPNGFVLNYTAQSWLMYALSSTDDGYEFSTETNNINKACAKLYADNGGTIGIARSITLEDINRVTGFTEPTFKKYTFISGATNKYEEGKVNYYYPSLLGEGRTSPTGVAEYFAKTGEKLSSSTVLEQSFDCNAYEYYKDNSDNKYKIWWQGESDNWQTIETDRLTLLDNLKYVIGENNNLTYAVGSCSVRVNNTGVNFRGAGVYNGHVDSFKYYFCYSGSNSANNYGNSSQVPVRPIVTLNSDVQLTKTN